MSATAPPKPRIRLSETARGGHLAARYDAAQTNDDNAKHWQMADGLSARAAHSPAVRRLLRIRCRYEVGNSPLARGVLRRFADFVVGTGPRVQIKTKDREYNRAVERAFIEWSIATGFARKLWQMRFAKALNGEAFALFFTNHALRTPVKLDLRTIEADQVADPSLVTEHTAGSDGIIFDDFGNPLGYRILKRHPGDDFALPGLPSDFETFPADDVIHYFSAERPGQVRGVPEITAALPLFAMRRRYLLAVLAAAETAADVALTIESQQSPDDPDEVEPLDPVDLERRAALTMPRGWGLKGFKAEQPTTTVEMFDGVIIRELARCVNMPYGIAALDSSTYNFASGKLDHLPWFQTLKIEQDELEDMVADRAFVKFFEEASRIPGYLPPSPLESPTELPTRQYFWDGQDLLDPREAGAKATGLQSGFETHGRIFAKRGEDVLDEWEAQAEILGITLDEYRKLVLASVFKSAGAAAPDPKQKEAEDEDS